MSSVPVPYRESESREAVSRPAGLRSLPSFRLTDLPTYRVARRPVPRPPTSAVIGISILAGLAVLALLRYLSTTPAHWAVAHGGNSG